MKTLRNSNKNQQKQKQINILGNINVPKLYKRQNNDALLKQSHQRNNRQSPVSMQSYRQRSDSKTQVQSFTERNTYLSLKNNKCEEPDFYMPDTSRSTSKYGQGIANFEDICEKKDVTMVKKQIVSSQKKRFYYKEEYDTLLDGQKQFSKGKMSEISQSKTILPDYFAKLNSKPPKINQFDSSQITSQRQKRSLSPLEESQQQLFAKCYKETSHHLQLMLKEIHASQDNLAVIHQEILDTISESVKERASFIRSQLMEMVENILNDWQNNELMFVEQNQILFIDDLLELKEQLNERELKVNSLIQRLEKQKNQSWIIGDRKLNQQFNGEISKTKSIWKNVTTDLLMFNYEDSIIEIQELSEKISSSIPEKCKKAIEILPSSQFRMTNANKNGTSDALYQLKTSIIKTISEILQNCKNKPEQRRQQNKSRKHSQTTQFSKRNPKKNLGF